MRTVKIPDPKPGDRYNRWTVVGPAPSRHGNRYFQCVCLCGVERAVYKSNLISKLSISCGCHVRELSAARKEKGHGKVGTKIYWVWADMVGRCTNPNHKSFDGYGGRGITVDPMWRSFRVFYEDMGEPPEGLSLDRVDNEKGYSKENCRWATAEQQANNKRSSVKHRVGEDLLTLREISDKFSIPLGAVRYHVYVKKLPVSNLVISKGTKP